MMNLLAVVIGLIILVWLLLVRRPGVEKTLSAWRWMVLAWGLLIFVHLSSPIEYLVYQLSTSTVLYSILWIGMFILGDKLGRRSYKNQSFTENDPSSAMAVSHNGRMTRNLTMLSMVGLVLLGITIGISSVFTGGSGLAELRIFQVEGTYEGIMKTIATFLATVGLVAFSVDLSTVILANRKFHWFSTAGFAAYLCTYVFLGGRSGWILGGGCLLIVVVASQQFVKIRYRYFNRLVAFLMLAGILGSGYMIAVVATRTSGLAGSMDKKIALFNFLGRSDLDEEFRESLRPIGPAGDAVIEMFYYLSPQLYGLDYSLQHYRGDYGWGMTQFPYITRRFEQLYDVRLTDDINAEVKWIFKQRGLAANFFRTAVHSTFLDFGIILGLPFVLGCGFLAGRNRANAIHLRAPAVIALQALICSGAAWTIIFSPFAEPGWAFPLMWFLILRATMKSSQPMTQRHVPHISAKR